MENNTYGIYLWDLCENITIYANCFIYNDFQAYDDGSNYWNSTSRGNFWSDYTGEDTDSDGIGDSPYYIDSNSIDYYPMMFCSILPDHDPPEIQILNPSNRTATNETNIMLSCNIEEKYLKEVKIIRNETLITKTRNKTIEIAIDLPSDGVWLIKIIAVDFRNNTNTETLLVIRDTVSPSLQILLPENESILASSTVNVSWSASDETSGIAYFNVSIDGGAWVSTHETYYVFSGLADGSHVVVVRAVDEAGNYVDRQVVFVVDTVPPSLEILSPSNGSIVRNASLRVVWNAVDEGSGIAYFLVRLDSGEWIRTNNTEYTFSGLSEGQHTITIRAYDRAGNMNEAKIIVTVEIPKVGANLITYVAMGIATIVAVAIIMMILRKRKYRETTLGMA